MRRLLRNSKKRGERKETDPFDSSRGNSGRAVEPDDQVRPSEHGHRAMVDSGSSAIQDPTNWATEKRKSLGQKSKGSQRTNTSPDRSTVASKKSSRASFDDVFSDDVEVDSNLNPDVEVQIDADSDEYETYNIPKPGTREKATRTPKKASKKAEKSTKVSTRLSVRFSKLLSSGRSNAARETDEESDQDGPSLRKPSEREKKKTSLTKSLVNQSKRLSFKKPATPEKQAARAAKLRAKQDKKDEERRMKEIQKNPWYPAGVDFKFLSPKPKWIPFLGRRASANELDFGNEARLIGAAV